GEQQCFNSVLDAQLLLHQVLALAVYTLRILVLRRRHAYHAAALAITPKIGREHAQHAYSIEPLRLRAAEVSTQPVPIASETRPLPVCRVRASREFPPHARRSFFERVHGLGILPIMPGPIDQNSCALWRNPRDMMRQG